jgi:hypothetical protein
VSAVLNGRDVLGVLGAGPPDDGRLALTGLAAENTLVVEAEADGDVLIRFTDPADGAAYVMFTGYPTLAPGLFCCFDQVDLTATTTLSLALPAGWECLSNGPVISQPEAGEAGRWRFGPVDGTRPFDLPVPQVRHRVRAPAERAGHLDPRADAGQREPAGPDGRSGRRLRGDDLRA